MTSYSSVIAPELMISEWLNAENDLTLETLRGNVVVMEAFQMLCLGCVSRSLSQIKSVQ